MNSAIVVSIISASAAIIVAALTFLTTKQREREAEWRKEKLSHYKDYFAALAANVGAHSNAESSKKYAIAFNTVGLFASQDVIECLHRYQDLTCLTSEQIDQVQHDRMLTELVLAIRKDLKLKPKDNANMFSYKLIASSASKKTYKAIKVTRYTRRFWYGVRCALLVQRGTLYGRRYAPRAKCSDG